MDILEDQEASRSLTSTLIAAAIVGITAWYVPKDFMKPGAARGLVRGGGLAAGLGLYMLDSSKHLKKLRQDLGEVDEGVAEEIGDAAEDASEAFSGTDESAGKSAAQNTAAQAAPGQIPGNKLVFAALVAAMALALVASFGLGLLLEKKTIAAMARRGVKYPNTIWGAVNAAAAVGTFFLDDSYDATLPGGVFAK